MATRDGTFVQWLTQAGISTERLTVEQTAPMASSYLATPAPSPRLYETSEALIVQLDPFRGQEELLPIIDDLNAGNHRLPWLDNRRLVMSLTPRGPARAGP